MKQLACEMCGSENIIKQDGLFVCQQCGTRYSLEEARKLMMDGADSAPSVRVRVDDSDELNNLYMLARRAKSENNSENAAKYYDMILVKDPNSWEASFYLVYYKAMGCKIANIQSAANSVTNCLGNALELIRSYVTDGEEQAKAISEISTSCATIALMLHTAAKNHYDGIGISIRSNYTQEMLNNCCAARDICYTLGNKIETMFPDVSAMAGSMATAWKVGISLHHPLITYFAQKDTNRDIIRKYVAKVQKVDSAYTGPDLNPPATNSGCGCYVATAVYGSYDCPQVWTLRRYRDYTLAESWYGRAFIRTYYAVSPTLVKWFGRTRWFRKMWQGTLDRMVADLNARGVENTPYEDRLW